MKVPDILATIDKHFDAMRSTRAARSVHASNIGHPCERSLVYDQIVGGKKPSIGLQRIFAIGELLHRHAVKLLMEAFEDTDVEVLLQEDEMPRNRAGIGGRIDISIAYYDGSKRVRIPIEIKTCSPFVFARLETLRDVRESSMQHVRKWSDQLLTYLHLKKLPVGLLLLIDKSSFQMRTIEITLDGNKTRVKQLFAKALRVTKLVAVLLDKIERCMKTDDCSHARAVETIERDLPERIEYTQSLCGHCDHRDRCVPDFAEKGWIEQRLWHTELEAWCRLRESSQELHETWIAADEKIKGHCKSVLEECENVEQGDERAILLDDFIVTAKRSSGVTYKVPKQLREKYKSSHDRTLVKVERKGADVPQDA